MNLFVFSANLPSPVAGRYRSKFSVFCSYSGFNTSCWRFKENEEDEDTRVATAGSIFLASEISNKETNQQWGFLGEVDIE
jgi:hypothetical protein